MLTRVVQMVFALAGMALVLRYGITRDPDWGETSNLHPVIWSVHWGPLGLGILCLLLVFATIALFREEP